MLIFIQSFALLFGFHSASHAAEPNQFTLKHHFEGINSSTQVKLVRIGPKENGRYLIEASGIDSPLNGQPLIYESSGEKGPSDREIIYRPVGTSGKLALYNRHRQTLIKGTVVKYWELFIGSNTEPVRVIESVEKSKTLDAQSLLNSYYRLNGITLQEKATKEAVTSELTASSQKAAKNCGSPLKVDVDWREFESKKLVHIAGAGTVILQALSDLCAADVDYKEAIAKLKTVHLQFSKTERDHSLERKQSVLVVSLPAEPTNIPIRTHEWLKENL